MQKLERIKKYKDAEPEKTVEYIRGLLDRYGIEIKENYHHIDTADINSCRIKIANEGLEDLDIGTNGKGMSLEYTRASAYGEFIERLANNFLIPGDEANIEGLFYLKKEDAAPYVKAYCREVFGENEVVSDFYLNEIYDDKIKILTFNDVINNKKAYLPVSLLSFLTGSNGMSAGNSKEEAVIQGISEIFERQVHYELVINKITPPEIDRAYFAGTDIFLRLEELDRAGYEPRILDLSLGKGFPVIGLILYHNGRYRVRLGSDPSPVTALERCFTEIFQGYDSINDELFTDIDAQKAELESFEGSEADFWFGQFCLGINNGSGCFPLTTVLKDAAPDYEFKGFEHPVSLSNEDDLNYYIEIIRRNSKKLYVCDRSSLGFPVYYSVIPTFSENMITNDDGRFFASKSKCSLEKSNLKRVHSLNKDELLNLASALETWYETYAASHNYINSMFEFCTFKPFHKYKAIAYLYACGGDKAKAHEFLDKYLETYDGKIDRQLFVKQYIEEGSVEKCFPADELPVCPDCDRCGIKSTCRVDEVIRLSRHIREAVKNKT